MGQNVQPVPDIVNTAMEIADSGIPVFPVNIRKMPAWTLEELGLERGQGGFKIATTDPDEIERLFSHPQTTGIGMPTGKTSGCTVIDVDCGKGKKHQAEATAWLDQHRQSSLWGSAVVRTASGGLHYYCRYTEGLKNAASVWADGVDCRNDGGYVVIPPFMGYRWVRQTEKEDWPAPPAVPSGRQRGPIRIEPHKGETPEQIVAMARLIKDGVTWHDPVRDIVAHLVGSGWSDAEILRFTFQWTWAGFDARTTFEDLCIMIAGARAKWSKDQEPVTTDQARIDAFAGIWNRSSPAARKVIADMVREAQKNG